jgi:hypothetical protein
MAKQPEKPNPTAAQVDSDASTLTETSRHHVSAPVVIPDHELIRQIGSGSYGEVWLAKRRREKHFRIQDRSGVRLI